MKKFTITLLLATVCLFAAQSSMEARSRFSFSMNINPYSMMAVPVICGPIVHVAPQPQMVVYEYCPHCCTPQCAPQPYGYENTYYSSNCGPCNPPPRQAYCEVTEYECQPQRPFNRYYNTYDAQRGPVRHPPQPVAVTPQPRNIFAE